MLELKSNEERAKNLLIILYVAIGFNLVLLAGKLYHYYLVNEIYSGRTTDNRGVINAETFIEESHFYYILFLLACAFLFLKWYSRACYNLEQIAKGSLNYGAGLSTLVWFIPIMNLYAPYQVMEELHVNTEKYLIEKELATKKKTLLAVPQTWWGFWLLSPVLAFMTLAIDPYEIASVAIMNCIAATSTLITLILAIVMIKNYAKMEALVLFQKESGSSNEVISES